MLIELKTYTYTNVLDVMHMHTNTKIVRIEHERDRQPLLRAELKLVKFLHSATKKIIFIILGIWNRSIYYFFSLLKAI